MKWMKEPKLTVIIPTCGRKSLERTLQSIRSQKGKLGIPYNSDFVEVLVVGDTHQGSFTEPLSRVPFLCQEYDCQYLEYDGGEHMWGHPQRNYGQSVAKGKWISWLQDDDIYVPGAFAAIIESAFAPLTQKPFAPRLFRTLTWQAGVVWSEPELREGNIDANCIVAPNVPEKLGVWASRYNGDFDFIRDTCSRWDMMVWEPRVIAHGRPQ